MPQGVAPVYFTDENTLGLGKLLCRMSPSGVRPLRLAPHPGYPGDRSRP